MVSLNEKKYDEIRETVFSKIKMPTFYPTSYQMREIEKLADDDFMVLMMCYYYEIKMLPEKKTQSQKESSREVFKFLQKYLEITE